MKLSCTTCDGTKENCPTCYGTRLTEDASLSDCFEWFLVNATINREDYEYALLLPALPHEEAKDS